jgi:protein tyrosine/serine phosphatase
MKLCRIPMTTRVPPTPEQVAHFLALVSDPDNQPVYGNCAGGRHRTGLMTAILRMTAEQWTADQAFEEMKRYKVRRGLPAPGVQALCVCVSGGGCERAGAGNQ